MQFSDVKICSCPIWPKYFLSVCLRTLVTLKQTYYRSSYILPAKFIIMKWEILPEIFFSEYLVAWSSYFLKKLLGSNTFSNLSFLYDKYFLAQLLFRTSSFFRISNFSEYVLFQSGAFSEQLLFQKVNLFRGRYFLKKLLFLIVLRNQFRTI